MVGETFSQDCLNYYNQIVESSLSFVLSKMPKKAQKWADEQVVYEGGAKYNKQKNYFSYSATLLPQLFIMGLSPFHPKVINQINWLINNSTDWKITGYDKSTACTFTYAMVLATLSCWVKRVGSDLSPILTRTINSNRRISELIFGLIPLENTPFQLIFKNRIWIFFISVTMLIVILSFGSEINEKINLLSNRIVRLWDQTPSDRHDIIINVVAGFVYAIIAGSGAWIFNFIKKRGRRR
ncbi:hypothetical protein SAMN02745136_04642 [Anaerocolumna jejuensis DSM 15929]|uniref:Uncharacterized protein n=1 Tax=Anaerocolumna jejuensis DSM 15929 TaxID=1121322 RepID=A0A1M6ZNS5_9FIRM|nr:hypothetical protein [Anaerocolumna jejuensis]SHL31995.1 hypothetical protein SAMN02745136_04642 [Anaerocolumna jejuensis DSM 15929]